MKREWNCALFASELEDDETAAQALAAVAEPRFLEAVANCIEAAQSNGEKIWIATHRGKYDADGQDVTGLDEAAGTFRTDAYEFTMAESSLRVEREVELEGVAVSHMLAFELARVLQPEIVRSILDVKVILDRFGGQALIAPFVRDGHVIGYAFHWEHVSKVGRGQEPDAKIADPLPLVVAGSTNGNG